MKYLEIDISPGERNAFSVAAELENIAVRFCFRWMPYIGKWHCVIRDPANNVLGVSMVAPGGDIWMDTRDPRVPKGRIGWAGKDPYSRSDLGEIVKLYYMKVVQ